MAAVFQEAALLPTDPGEASSLLVCVHAVLSLVAWVMACWRGV